MQAILRNPRSEHFCSPITDGRHLSECLLANRCLKELLSTELTQVGFSLKEEGDTSISPRALRLPVDHWIDVGALCLLFRQSEVPTCLRDLRGDVVAWTGCVEPEDCMAEMVTQAACFKIAYPWDLLKLNEEILDLMEENIIEGQVHDLATIDGFLHLGRNSVILPGVYIEGNVIIGENCRIGPNAYLRGNTSIGNHCIIGNAVEVKNSILYPHVQIKHLSYVGDSILGAHTHLGAGTILANYRLDGKSHQSKIAEKWVNTQRLKFGAVLGDGVRMGVHSCVYPGRKIGAGRIVPPNTTVIKDLMNFYSS